MDLIAEFGSISSDGATVQILDRTDWGTAPIARGDLAIIGKGDFISEIGEKTYVEFIVGDPISDTEFRSNIPQDGHYEFTLYAFDTIEAAAGSYTGGTPYYNVAEGKFYIYTTELEDLESPFTEALHSSNVIEVPLLSKAYTYKNKLNLDYVALVQGDLSKGVRQNKMYYSRRDLDYFTALIQGAEYNWALALYSNFYDIVDKLNKITQTGKLV